MYLKKKNITSFIALLISIVTLLLFILQTRLQYKESRLSVVPRLTFNQDYKSTKKHIINRFKDTLTLEKVDFTLELINKGLGPAILKKLNYLHKNERIDINEFIINNKIIEDILIINHTTSISEDAILSKDEKLELFTLSINKKDFYELQKATETKSLENLIDVIVDYESIYEEPFQVRLHKKLN